MAATPSCLLLGDGVTDDTLLHIFSFSTTADDLVRLNPTCPRLAARVIAAPDEGPAAAPEMLLIPQEAARQWLAGCSEQEERGWVSHRTAKNWLCRMHEVGCFGCRCLSTCTMYRTMG